MSDAPYYSRRTKAARFQLGVEELETRITPTGNPFPGLGSALKSDLASGFAAVTQDVGQMQAALPIIGKSLAQEGTSITNALNGIGGATNAALAKLNLASTKDQAVQQLQNTGIFSSLTIPIYDPANGNITVTAHFHEQVSLGSTGFRFTLGLPGVPFSLTAQLAVGFSVDYGDVSFGLKGGNFFLQSPTPGGGSLTVDLTAQAVGLSFTGTIGFFQVTATPITGKPPVSLDVGFALDASGNTFSNPRLTGGAQVNLHLDANLKTGLGGVSFPHMVTDFLVNWPLAGSASVSTDAGLGSAPTVEFQNVGFSLGTFLGSMVAPIANIVDEITAPLAPVYAALEAPIPGLSDLGKAAGLGTISLDTLAAATVGLGVLPPDYQLLADLGLRLHTLIELIRNLKFGTSNDPVITLGSFDLSGNGDLRTSTLENGLQSIADWVKNGASLEDLSTLVPNLLPGALKATDSVEDAIRNNLPSLGVLDPIIGDQVNQVFTNIDDALRTASNGVSLSFPLLDNPVSLYKLLLGQDVDFVKFDGSFFGTAAETKDIPVWGPIQAQFSGAITFNLALHVGVDTFGLREFFISVINGHSNPAVLGDGLYFDSSTPLVSFSGGISASVGPEIDVGEGLALGVKADLNGSVQTNGPVTVSFVNPPLQDGDDVLRPFKSGEVPGPLFVAKGKITANFNFKVSANIDVTVGPFTKTLFGYTVYSKTLANVVLFNSSTVPTADPLPKPAPPAASSIDVDFDANLFDDAPDGNNNNLVADAENGVLSFIYNGEVETTYELSTVRSVTIYGSYSDLTFFTIKGDFGPTIPIQVEGGTGNDLLTFDDTGFSNPKTTYYSIHDSLIERELYVQVGLANVLALSEKINFQGLSAVGVWGATASKDVFSIYQLSLQTSVLGGDQGNQFLLGGPGQDVGDVFNDLYMQGGLGYDQVILADAKETRPAQYTVERDDIKRDAILAVTSPFLPGTVVGYIKSSETISYHNIDSIQIEGSGSGNTFYVNDEPDAIEENPQARLIELDTGAGNDSVTVAATTGRLIVHGEGGNDAVTVGVPQVGTLNIFGNVDVDNSGGKIVNFALPRSDFTTLNVNDADDPSVSKIKLTTDTLGNGLIYGFLGSHQYADPFNQNLNSNLISYKASDVNAVNVQCGDYDNTVEVDNTPLHTSPFGIPIRGGIVTNLMLGSNVNTVYVLRTTGVLNIDSLRSGLSYVYLGGNETYPGNLTVLNGNVNLAGSYAEISIKDAANSDHRFSYTMDAASFSRTDPTTGLSIGTIAYSGATPVDFDVDLAGGGNTVVINGTPQATEIAQINTGAGNDTVQVNGLNVVTDLDLGAGTQQYLSIGSPSASLGHVTSQLTATGSNVYTTISDQASKASDPPLSYTIKPTFGLTGEEVERFGQQSAGQQSMLLNDFIFQFNSLPFTSSVIAGVVQLIGGKATESINIYGTPPQILTAIDDVAGLARTYIATDDDYPDLGKIDVTGSSSYDDLCYFFVLQSASSQTYTFTSSAIPATASQLQVVQRAGSAPVTLRSINTVDMGPSVAGGDTVSIDGVPSNETLLIGAAGNDTINVGDGNLSKILGHLEIESKNPYYDDDTTVNIDDSADLTSHHVVIHPAGKDPASGAYCGEFFTGFAPGTIDIALQKPNSSSPASGCDVNVRGGTGNDTFSLAAVTGFAIPVRIDGGKGVNTLDYSLVTGKPQITVNLAGGTATGLDDGIVNIQKVTGVPPS